MATIKELLEIENARERNDVIHLFGEGSFWRAYEMSAWLCVRSVNEFKVTKRKLKGIESPITFIGFPQSSFDKWFSVPFQVVAREEKHLVVEVPAEKLPEAEKDRFPQLFALWKDNLPLAADSKTSTDSRNKPSHLLSAPETGLKINSLTDAMKAILSFPVESKSPIECMLFLAEMKRLLATII